MEPEPLREPGRLKHHRGTPSDVAEILKKPISQEMLNRDLARLAYVAKDGTPRVVPIAFTWNGTEVVMCTTTNAPKLASLRRNPAVALTTGAGQALRHAQPEAAVAAGDEGHVAGQVEGRSRGGGLDGSGRVDGR